MKNKLVNQLKAYKPIEVPYSVWTCFGKDSQSITLAGDQASFGCDYKSLEELRKAIEWYAGQLGGKVKWEK